MYSHLGHARHVVKKLDSKLHVIAVVFNPLRFLSRYNLFREFEQHALAHGANLWVVEMAFGNRPFEVVREGEPQHIAMRTEHELWHKERIINAAVARLPHDWEYVAWVDADLTFINPDWVHETIQQLQHYHIVQMFTHAMDIGPNMEPIERFESFAHSYINGIRDYPKLNGVPGHRPKKHRKHCNRPGNCDCPSDTPDYYGGRFWHPGYGWAYRRSAWDTLGGLLDINIVGGGDHQMAYGLIDRIEETIPADSTHQYTKSIRQWAENASILKRNIGAVPGTIAHHFHGRKVNRNYYNRWKILTENAFDPMTDLKNDWQQAHALTGNKIKLRDDLRGYFRARHEDSTG